MMRSGNNRVSVRKQVSVTHGGLKRRSDFLVVCIGIGTLALLGKPAGRSLFCPTVSLNATIAFRDEGAGRHRTVGNERRDLEERIVEPVLKIFAGSCVAR